MSRPRYIFPLTKTTHMQQNIGNKAASLQRLLRHGMLIPRTFVCTWDAYHDYLADNPNLVGALQTELAAMLDPTKTYAVRSSANIEDSLERSFAGQFKSVLNVRGVDGVLQSMWGIWGTTRSPSVQTYLDRHHIPAAQLSMAVIIQEMVAPVYSGVALSKNPVTGGDEVVVEAVAGEGSQLVQSGVTPARWVNKWGYWVEKAAQSDIPAHLIEQIITETRHIAATLRHPVDLEWVYNGSSLHWVQVRAITNLQQRSIYSNYIPREMLPGMIKPLIYSINIPLVNKIWIDWISEITGDLGLKPDDLAKSFYYRVYFNMGTLGDIFEGLGFPRESVEMLMGTLPRGAARPSFKPSTKTFSRLPWLLAFAWDKWRFAPKMRRALPGLEQRVRATPIHDLEQWSDADLFAAIDAHYSLMQEVAYYNVLGPLLMGMYNNALKARLAKKDVDFNAFDLTENMPELAAYDPSTHLADLHTRFTRLPPEQQTRIRGMRFDELMQDAEARDFAGTLRTLVERFGYLSDNGNDFSYTPWREAPDMVLRLVTDYNPAPAAEAKKLRLSDLQTQGKADWLTRLFYARAREFRLLREQVSGLYTHGYGLFRHFFLELGQRLTRRGLLDQREDIYFLTYAQIRQLAAEQPVTFDPRQVVSGHKADMERYRDILLPTVIYGDEVPPVREANMKFLVGIPTSIGHYTGRVKVVRGIQDFGKVDRGDVLVIPYSDVGWTPLFARAGAVVAESGGLLSHSSIVAREYNIPAVVSVEGATRMPDETLVTVDGHKGEVLIHA